MDLESNQVMVDHPQLTSRITWNPFETYHAPGPTLGDSDSVGLTWGWR